MDFTVPSSLPPAVSIQAPSWIKASQLRSFIEVDRYVFATRRRAFLALAPMLADAGPTDFGVASARVSPQSAGGLELMIYGQNVDVTLTVAGVGSVTASATTAGVYTATLSGLAVGTWYSFGVQSVDTGSPAMLKVVFVREPLLTAADL